jgi:hypothetical protein
MSAKKIEAAPEIKPGIKTSEFYSANASTGGLFTLVLTESDWRVRVAALLAIGIVQGAYALSRGIEKSAMAGAE